MFEAKFYRLSGIAGGIFLNNSKDLTMTAEQYYPCIKDWGTGEISKRVGPAMSWEIAVQYLKQHHSGAWQQAHASPQPVSREYFTGEDSTRKLE